MSSAPAAAAPQPGKPNGPALPPWLLTIFPFLRWWRRVDRGTLKVDFLAGLTGAVVVLPQGVAFATIAGMPPEYGLYAGIVPGHRRRALGLLLAPGLGADDRSLHRGVLGPLRLGRAGECGLCPPGPDPDPDGRRAGAGHGDRPPGVPGQLHLPLGGGGLHRRGRLPDRRQPVQELLRDRDPPGAALPRDARDPAAESRAHESPGHRGRGGHPRPGAGSPPLVSAASRT